MMNGKIFKTAGIMLFLALTATLIYFCVSLHTEVETEKVESQKNFSRYVTETSDSAEFFGFMTKNFIEHQAQLQERLPSPYAVTISDNRGIVYTYPSDAPIIGFDPYGQPVMKTNSPLKKIYSSSVSIHPTGRITITAVYSLLHHEIIVFYMRNTFLIILAITILTLIFILLGNKTNVTSAVHTEFDDADSKTSMDAELDTLLDTIGESDIHPSTEDQFENSEIEEIEDEPIETLSSNAKPEEILQEQNLTKQYSDLTVASEPIIQDKPFVKDDSTDDPLGLFSKATGVCWEKYLIDRLTSELSRAVETEQDLALFVIRIDMLDRFDIVSRKIANYLVSQFKFRDLVFESGKDGYAVILPSCSFTIAMKEAEMLYTEVLSLLSTNGYKKQISIGLTLRSGRILSGERFFTEAENACTKAKSEADMPVVAFRADPEKYRSFISET